MPDKLAALPSDRVVERELQPAKLRLAAHLASVDGVVAADLLSQHCGMS